MERLLPLPAMINGVVPMLRTKAESQLAVVVLLLIVQENLPGPVTGSAFLQE